MTTALTCVALLGLLLFGLGFGVSIARGKAETLTGSSGDPSDRLQQLVRAHGNTAEYAPMMALLIFILGSMSPATWMLWLMGIATASRYLIAVGLLGGTMDRPHPLRFAGALGTYLSGFALCIALCVSAFGAA